MLGRIFSQMRQSLISLENNVWLVLGKRYPPDEFCTIFVEDCSTKNRNPEVASSFSLDTLLKDTILWAVPKHRRTLEKRLNRKFGWPNQVWKPIVPKKNLLMCRTCGDHYEGGHLCPTCYSRVKKETEEVQKVIENELGLNPIEKEVVILYQGEKDGVPDEFFKGKRIIEVEKERPAWFSKNLLQRTTQPPATTTSVKPSDLA